MKKLQIKVEYPHLVALVVCNVGTYTHYTSDVCTLSLVPMVRFASAEFNTKLQKKYFD